DKSLGAGNALSNFKAGDKVQISVNSQGRVNELRLENGAKFIRQADGSYIYKK
ncbi:opacity associated protein A, partial [Pasteurella multocida subsp. multocida str. Anand1_buffalo]